MALTNGTANGPYYEDVEHEQNNQRTDGYAQEPQGNMVDYHAQSITEGFGVQKLRDDERNVVCHRRQEDAGCRHAGSSCAE